MTLALIGQREHVERVARRWRVQVRRDCRRHEARAAAAVAARDADVLLAVDAERDRKSLDRRPEPGLPQHLARLDVERPETAIEVAGKRHAPRCRNRRGHEGRALLIGPHLLHRADVERGELADVALGPRHLVEAPAGAAAAAAAFLLLDFLSAHLQAALTERDDQLVGRLVIRRRRPIVPAFGARASLHPDAELLLEDVSAIRRTARFRIEALPHVLENRFLVPEVLAGPPTELPQHAVLADREL